MRVLLIACAAALTGSGVASAAAGSTGNGAIAFLRDGKVWVVEPDGSGERALAVTGDAGIPPQWSPTGALLAATRVDYGGGTSVPFVVRADGSPAGSGFVPYGSPVCWLGSARLLVLAQPSGMSPQADLYAVNADGSGLERLTSDGEAKNVTRQACAGDGSGVVYGETEPSTGVTLAYWVSAAGGAPRLLTPAGALDSVPSLSPDGKKVVLYRYSAGPPWVGGLVVTGLDGKVESRISPAGPATGDVQWSPDGSKLLYVAELTTPGGDTYDVVHVADADGTGARDLTSSLGVLSATWSPDGGRIAYVTFQGPAPNIRVENVDGTCALGVAYGDDTPVDWQPRPGEPGGAGLRCADLSLTAGSGLLDPVAIGETAYFPFSVTNTGNETATGVTVTLTPPAGMPVAGLQLSPGSCSLESLSCTVAALPPDAGVSVVMSVIWNARPDFAGDAVPTLLTAGARATAGNDANRFENDVSTSVPAYPCTKVGGPFRTPDFLEGTRGRDVLCGLSGPDALRGLGGRDTLVGGSGSDFLDGGPGRDLLLGGKENDTILAADGFRDEIDCGGPREDTAIVDRRDHVVNCERVARPRVRCARVGTRGPDRLVGTPKRDVLCGLWGNDTIDGLAGNDAIDGGQGNDTIDGGAGRDRIFAGAGYDTILVRDGERDRIDCGKDYDTVIADRLDRTARNCEHVLRARP